MNSKYKWILQIVGILGLILLIKTLGFLRLYKNPTRSMEPNSKANSTLLTTNLVSPNIGDGIVFKYRDSVNNNTIYFLRLIGKPKDTIEIKKGLLFKNRKNVDENLDLVYDYKVTNLEYQNLLGNEEFIGNHNNKRWFNQDTLLIKLKKSTAESKGLTGRRFIMPKNKRNKEILNKYDSFWNKDNFGPLIVPRNKYFVLGDNRDNSYDSRYIGFVDQKDLLGIVILNW